MNMTNMLNWIHIFLYKRSVWYLPCDLIKEYCAKIYAISLTLVTLLYLLSFSEYLPNAFLSHSTVQYLKGCCCYRYCVRIYVCYRGWLYFYRYIIVLYCNTGFVKVFERDRTPRYEVIFRLIWEEFFYDFLFTLIFLMTLDAWVQVTEK
jgi:hypothetical protein